MLVRTPTDLGAVIRDRRRQLGLDQATLAARVGVSRQWIIAIERGRSRAELGLLRTLDELGIRLDLVPVQPTAPSGAPSVDLDAIVRSARTVKQ